MRFSVVISGLFAVMAAAESTVSAPPTSVALSPAQQSQMNCFKACAEGDVNCQARCVGVSLDLRLMVSLVTLCVLMTFTPERREKSKVMSGSW